MIKSLFEHDEEIKETKAAENTADGESIEELTKAIETGIVENVSAKNIAKTPENVLINETQPIEPAEEIRQVEPIPTFQISEFDFEDDADEMILEVPDYEAELEAKINKIARQTSSVQENQSAIESVVPIENAGDFSNQTNEPQSESVPVNKKEYAASEPTFQFETQSETVRRTGLAFSAAITLFGAVAFMMIIGWFFDLICGTSPWGIVGGVAFGALIGFIQFFRQTSQIFKNKT